MKSKRCVLCMLLMLVVLSCTGCGVIDTITGLFSTTKTLNTTATSAKKQDYKEAEDAEVAALNKQYGFFANFNSDYRAKKKAIETKYADLYADAATANVNQSATSSMISKVPLWLWIVAGVLLLLLLLVAARGGGGRQKAPQVTVVQAPPVQPVTSGTTQLPKDLM